ncbi:MAG: proton-conducting transporter membrane subunit [Candidatus Omnitrophica bacterium]|nr:proton-conducting transporter membrane subunit [Candidatus Omnitrophota bacterium]
MCLALILIPFFSIIILNLPPREVNKRIAFGLVLILTLGQMFLVFFPGCNFWKMNSGVFGSMLKIDLLVDNLTLIMLFCIGLIVLVTLFTSRQFIGPIEKQRNFINLLLVVLIGMNGTVLARDIFSLYVFLEITAVASFILISFDKELLGLEGAFKYLLLSAIATILMLSSIALLLILTGSTGFSEVQAVLKTLNPNNPLLILAVGLFLAALFIKSGLIPFHGWLPDAYSSAPASVSVLLAGIVTKVAGVYALIRIMVSVLGFSPASQAVLLLIGAVSIVLGALLSLTQSDFKRMLAYSSISQVGYIILGLGSGTALGIVGAVFHIFNHCVFKSLLFINSAAIEKQTGIRDMDKLSGLAQKMPVTGLSSLLASLSAAGIPPLAGFWSKLIIIIALWSAGYYTYAVIGILAGILTLAYFLSLQRRVFFGKLTREFINVKEASFSLVFPMVLLSVIIIGVGVFTPVLLDKFILGLGNILGG